MYGQPQQGMYNQQGTNGQQGMYGQGAPQYNQQPQYNQPQQGMYGQQPQQGMYGQPQQGMYGQPQAPQQQYGQSGQYGQSAQYNQQPQYNQQQPQQTQYNNNNGGGYNRSAVTDFKKSQDRTYMDANGDEWDQPMINQPCLNPCRFLYGCLCGCCFAYQQREDILIIVGGPNGEAPYRPCGGYFCCCETPECPKIPFLCCEACCCTWTAIMVNRYMIRDMYNLKLDPCDECLLWCACVCSWIVCILQILGIIEDDSLLEFLVDCFIMSVLGCSLAQNHNELEKREGGQIGR